MEYRYSDTDKFKNYKIVLNCIKTIEDEEITEDWVEFHKDRITLYREWVYDYSLVNPEVHDIQFRKMATHVETLLGHLLRQVYEDHTFDPSVYLLLNHAMKYMIEYFMESDELSDFMDRMAI
jgi:hypothetical protein